MAAAFTADDVRDWDIESVCGWLHLLKLDDLIPAFRDNDINGLVLLDTDDELLAELKIPLHKRPEILKAVEDMKKGDGAGAEWGSDSDSDNDSNVSGGSSASLNSKTSPPKSYRRRSSGATAKMDKKKDPLRLAAKHKAVADLDNCTVTSGFLWKVGGSGIKLKHWKRRYFVLTDDNCLYYFKSPKEVSALGMILLPSYTITVADKSESPGSRNFAFKAFNREHEAMRKYIFAADTMEEMKTWMNVMSLASIAFGSGKASMAKEEKGVSQLAHPEADIELQLMQKRAAERAGGVTGDAPTASAAASGAAASKMPAFLKKTQQAARKRGPKLCLIKLLDGQTLQLWAEPKTIGQNLLDQICLMLSAHEKYYFGLAYIDSKNEEEWMKLDKRVLKHDIPLKGGDHLEMEFRVRFYPMDVTQVLQYVTLYQVFLASKAAIVNNQLEVSNKDALLLASLALQAQRGDYNSAEHSPEVLIRETLVPLKNMSELKPPPGVKVESLGIFLAEEVIRIWKTLQGILKHLAVLKYMQIMQKHPLFAMQSFEIKNKKGTPLNMGINPHGLFIYRYGQQHRPIVTFSWAETSELSFTEKKFMIQVHDKETRAFTVYCNRAKQCQRILYLCIGLHRLYVQTIRNWQDAPADLAYLRQEAIQAALKEREQLKKEAAAVRAKAKALRAQRQAEQDAHMQAVDAQSLPPPPDPLVTPHEPLVQAEPLPPPPAEDFEDDDDEEEEEQQGEGKKNLLQTGEGQAVEVKGRDEAVRMIDLMMNDTDFMEYQEMLLSELDDDMAAMMEGDFRLRSWTMDSTAGEAAGGQDIKACDSEGLGDRVDYLAELDHH